MTVLHTQLNGVNMVKNYRSYLETWGNKHTEEEEEKELSGSTQNCQEINPDLVELISLLQGFLNIFK